MTLAIQEMVKPLSSLTGIYSAYLTFVRKIYFQTKMFGFCGFALIWHEFRL